MKGVLLTLIEYILLKINQYFLVACLSMNVLCIDSGLKVVCADCTLRLRKVRNWLYGFSFQLTICQPFMDTLLINAVMIHIRNIPTVAV